MQNGFIYMCGYPAPSLITWDIFPPFIIKYIIIMPSFLKVFRRQQKKQTSTNGVPQRGTKRKRPSKGRDERVLAFTQWCKRVGIWLHPKVSNEALIRPSLH